MPRKILIYGPPKIGKSTLAGSAKNSILIPTEDRVGHIDCSKAPIANRLEDIFNILKYLVKEKKNHGFENVILDTLDWTEPLVHDYVCRTNGFSSITDDTNKETAFQKGLKYHAVSGWRELLSGLDYVRTNGISVILIAHDAVIKCDPPSGDAYDKSVMKIDKNALPIIEEWADVIGYYDRNVLVQKDVKQPKKTGKAIESNVRRLNLSGQSPAYISGNSFGLVDIDVDLDYASDIMEYLLRGSEKNENKNENEKTKIKTKEEN